MGHFQRGTVQFEKMSLAISSHGKDGEEWVCRRNQVCCLKQHVWDDY